MALSVSATAFVNPLIPRTVIRIIRDVKRVARQTMFWRGDSEIAKVRAGLGPRLWAFFGLLVADSVVAVLGLYAIPFIVDAATHFRAAGQTSPMIFYSKLAAVTLLLLLPLFRPLLDSALRMTGSQFTQKVRSKIVLHFFHSADVPHETPVSPSVLYNNAAHYVFNNLEFPIRLPHGILHAILSTYFLYRLAPSVSIVVLLSAPLIGSLTYYFGNKLRSLNDNLNHENGRTTSHQEELLNPSQVYYTKVNSVTSWSLDRLVNAYARVREIEVSTARTSASYAVIREILVNLLTTGILAHGVWLMAVGVRDNFSTLSAVLGLAAQMRIGIVNTFEIVKRRAEEFGATQEVSAFLRRHPLLPETALSAAPLNDGGIDLKNVSLMRETGMKTLDDINLNVPAGQMNLIMGESGAGKTTLFRLISGALAPEGSDARITVGGLAAGRGGHEVSYVVQEEILLPELSVDENLERRGPLPEEKKLEALHLAGADFAIARGLDTQVRAFSGGQRKRLEIALALVTHPRILLLDEPFTGQDGETTHRLAETLNALRNGGTTVLMITHQVPKALQPDRVYHLSGGKLTATQPRSWNHRRPYAFRSSKPRRRTWSATAA